MKRALHIPAVSACLLLSGICQGQVETRPAPTAPPDVAKLLRERNFTALEAHFSAIEEEFEKGGISEFELVDDYKPFYSSKSKNLEREFDAWISAYPDSYAAHVARGTYYRTLGQASRGENLLSDVPAEALSKMNQDFANAEVDLKQAGPLAEKPYVAMLGLLNIARYRGDEDAAYGALQLGNQALPSNILIRALYQDHLKPRWGGSYQKMRDFVYISGVEGLAAKDLGLLSAMADDDRASAAEDGDDVDEAITHYDIALTKAQKADPRALAIYLQRSLDACRNKLVSRPECR